MYGDFRAKNTVCTPYSAERAAVGGSIIFEKSFVPWCSHAATEAWPSVWSVPLSVAAIQVGNKILHL
jgi:hypothetical protein